MIYQSMEAKRITKLDYIMAFEIYNIMQEYCQEKMFILEEIYALTVNNSIIDYLIKREKINKSVEEKNRVCLRERIFILFDKYKCYRGRLQKYLLKYIELWAYYDSLSAVERKEFVESRGDGVVMSISKSLLIKEFGRIEREIREEEKDNMKLFEVFYYKCFYEDFTKFLLQTIKGYPLKMEATELFQEDNIIDVLDKR